MQNLSIEQLENKDWGEPNFHSYVVETTHRAVKKPLKDLTLEEVRVLIGQKIGLKYILPIALEALQQNPIVEVTYYEGDLLCSVLRLEEKDWSDNPIEWNAWKRLLVEKEAVIRQIEEIPQEIFLNS